MKRANYITGALVLIAIIALFVFTSCTYIIDEREQAVVTRFNRPVAIVVGAMSDEDFKRLEPEINLAARRTTEVSDSITVHRGPGLYFKLPFNMERVEKFPDVILEYDADPREIVLADKKKLLIDNYARWHIENPLLFRITVRTIEEAKTRLDDVIYSVMREELGRNNIIEVIRTTNRFVDVPLELEQLGDSESDNPMKEHIERGREKILDAVALRCAETVRQFGVRILDVRIKRADLLEENLDAVFGRMQAERARISKGYRSEGEKEANIISGTTDKEVQIMLANAKRDAEILRGEGDAESVAIVAEAFGQNTELYTFMQSLDIISTNTPLGSEFVIGLNSSIYRLLVSEEALNTP